MDTDKKLNAAHRAPKVPAPPETGMVRIVRWVIDTERRFRATQDHIHGRSDTF